MGGFSSNQDIFEHFSDILGISLEEVVGVVAADRAVVPIWSTA